jgi:glycoprotein endo-alpha-1,2-mannosidase
VHWNHEFIQHWNANEAKRWPSGKHDPNQNDIGADYYPKLGPYASASKEMLDQHMRWSLEAGIGVLVFSWYPPGKADENGLPSDPLVLPLLEAAHKVGIKICLHVEPYKERDVKAMQAAIQYATEQYASHPAYYHMKPLSAGGGGGGGGIIKSKPVFYVYDSYHIGVKDWSKLLKPMGQGGLEGLSIRGTSADAFMIFLLVESSHSDYARHGGFDGFYT